MPCTAVDPAASGLDVRAELGELLTPLGLDLVNPRPRCNEAVIPQCEYAATSVLRIAAVGDQTGLNSGR